MMNHLVRLRKRSKKQRDRKVHQLADLLSETLLIIVERSLCSFHVQACFDTTCSLILMCFICVSCVFHVCFKSVSYVFQMLKEFPLCPVLSGRSSQSC